MLFSTSSLTAVARVSTTCPEHIWCTECLSIALIAPAGSELIKKMKAGISERNINVSKSPGAFIVEIGNSNNLTARIKVT